MKNILVISQTSPFDKQNIRESLDLCLIFAAVEQNISWLLTDSALFALLKDQKPHSLSLKDYFKTIKTLEIYEVEQVYVCESALKLYGLTLEDFSIDVKALSLTEQQSLISQQDHLVTL